MCCNSLIVSTDISNFMPGDELEYDYVIISQKHIQAILDEAEDIGWNTVNRDYSFYCGALIRARIALSK